MKPTAPPPPPLIDPFAMEQSSVPSSEAFVSTLMNDSKVIEVNHLLKEREAEIKKIKEVIFSCFDSFFTDVGKCKTK